MVSSMRAVRTGSLEGRPCANRCAMDVSADATAPGVVADMSYQQNKWESARRRVCVRARAHARRVVVVRFASCLCTGRNATRASELQPRSAVVFVWILECRVWKGHPRGKQVQVCCWVGASNHHMLCLWPCTVD